MCNFPHHIFHLWSKWGEIEKGSSVSLFENIKRDVFVQKRKCRRCGKLQVRAIPIQEASSYV